jgi:hydrogenase maturation protease
MEPTWLVVGIGNRLQGADGFGPAVVDRLRRTPDLAGTIDVVDAGTDLLAQLDRFAAYDRVVLVDAVLADGEPRVAIVDEAAFSRWDDRSPSCHAVSPVVAVRLFRCLHPAVRNQISLVALTVDAIRFERSLGSDVVDAGAEAVIRLIGTLQG